MNIEKIKKQINKDIERVLNRDFKGYSWNETTCNIIKNQISKMLCCDRDFVFIRTDVRFNEDLSVIDITPLNIFTGLKIINQTNISFEEVLKRQKIINYFDSTIYRYSNNLGEYELTVYSDNRKPVFVFRLNQPLEYIQVTIKLESPNEKDS